jgi:uncharacterized protein
MKNYAIILMIKYPQLGNVKTRLAVDIGGFHATELYACFLKDMATMINKSNYPKVISYSPDDASTLSFFKNMFGENNLYFPQDGNNLGEKMLNAFAKTYENNFTKTVLIGSDTPQLSLKIIKNAFSALDTMPTVIGPSLDGGYYLIGFDKNEFHHKYFENISWSTDKVFSQTIRAVQKSYVLLQELNDIDTLIDLKQVYSDLLPNSATYKYITDNQLL